MCKKECITTFLYYSSNYHLSRVQKIAELWAKGEATYNVVGVQHSTCVFSMAWAAAGECNHMPFPYRPINCNKTYKHKDKFVGKKDTWKSVTVKWNQPTWPLRKKDLVKTILTRVKLRFYQIQAVVDFLENCSALAMPDFSTPKMNLK